MLDSKLWDRSDLPDSIQVQRILDLSLPKYSKLDHNELLLRFYPSYLKALDKYKLDRISGVRSLRNQLNALRQFQGQHLQAFGAVVSYPNVLMILPAIIFSLYFLALIYAIHLYNLCRVAFNRHADNTVYLELFNAPLLIMLEPRWLAMILIVIPALAVTSVVLDQLGIIGFQSPSASWTVIVIYSLIIPVVTVCLARCVRKIRHLKLLTMQNLNGENLSTD